MEGERWPDERADSGTDPRLWTLRPVSDERGDSGGGGLKQQAKTAQPRDA